MNKRVSRKLEKQSTAPRQFLMDMKQEMWKPNSTSGCTSNTTFLASSLHCSQTPTSGRKCGCYMIQSSKLRTRWTWMWFYKRLLSMREPSNVSSNPTRSLYCCCSRRFLLMSSNSKEQSWISKTRTISTIIWKKAMAMQRLLMTTKELNSKTLNKIIAINFPMKWKYKFLMRSLKLREELTKTKFARKFTKEFVKISSRSTKNTLQKIRVKGVEWAFSASSTEAARIFLKIASCFTMS